jgi:2'-5' RNA ligase
MALRLFCALTIPGDITETLSRFMRGVSRASWRPVDSLHVTLQFFGDVMEPDAHDLDAALEEAVGGIAPFSLTLKGAGFFGNAEPHALWIGVEHNPALHALSAACARAARRIGVPVDGRKYSPHVTMAYLHGTTPATAQAFVQRHMLFQSRGWMVDRFGMFSSHLRKNGPSLYQEEAAYPLLG